MFPFQRAQISETTEFDQRFRGEIIHTLKLLSENMSKFQPCVDAEIDLSENLIHLASEVIYQRYRLSDRMSEIAFRGLLVILEYCLVYELANLESFSYFLNTLSDNDAENFWVKAVPLFYESDMEHGTSYRDAVLFGLTLNDISTGKRRLRIFFDAVPGLRDSLLARNAKRFEEAFRGVVRRRTSTNPSMASTASSVAEEKRKKATKSNDDEFDQTQNSEKDYDKVATNNYYVRNKMGLYEKYQPSLSSNATSEASPSTSSSSSDRSPTASTSGSPTNTSTE